MTFYFSNAYYTLLQHAIVKYPTNVQNKLFYKYLFEITIVMIETFYFDRIEKCKFLDSKMKPLWLAFENADTYGKDIFIIFKSGDGKF